MTAHKCPFHGDSDAVEVDGDIHNVHCIVCGDYRISHIAMTQIAKLPGAPRGWRRLLARHTIISSRDTRALTANA